MLWLMPLSSLKDTRQRFMVAIRRLPIVHHLLVELRQLGLLVIGLHSTLANIREEKSRPG